MSSQEENGNKESTSGSASKDAIFEPKPKPKMIRVLTVVAYVLSVSMAAILLSIYYIFMWDGRPQLGARRSLDLGYQYLEHRNGSNTMVQNFSRRTYSDPNNLFNASKTNKMRPHYYPPVSGALRMTNETDDDILNAIINATEDSIISFVAFNETDAELQQQITALEVETHTTPPIPTTTEESVTDSDDYDVLNELQKRSTFLRKMMNHRYYGVY